MHLPAAQVGRGCVPGRRGKDLRKAFSLRRIGYGLLLFLMPIYGRFVRFIFLAKIL